MAKKEVSNTTENKLSNSIFKTSRGQKFIVGVLFVLIALILLLSFISYYISGNNDQSQITELGNRNIVVENWLGKIGAWLSDIFLHKGFGVASFLFVKIFFLIGAYLIVDLPLKKLRKSTFWDLYLIVTISILFGLLWDFIPHLSGIIGFEINDLIQDYSGKIGSILLLVFATIVFLIFKIKVSPDKVKDYLESKSIPVELNSEVENTDEVVAPILTDIDDVNEPVVPISTIKKPVITEEEDDEWTNMQVINRPEPTSTFEVDKASLKPTIQNSSEIHLESQPKPVVEEIIPKQPELIQTEDASFVIEKPEEEDIVEESLAQRLVEDFGLFDPTLELSNFKMPS